MCFQFSDIAVVQFWHLQFANCLDSVVGITFVRVFLAFPNLFLRYGLSTEKDECSACAGEVLVIQWFFQCQNCCCCAIRAFKEVQDVYS